MLIDKRYYLSHDYPLCFSAISKGITYIKDFLFLSYLEKLYFDKTLFAHISVKLETFSSSFKFEGVGMRMKACV